MSQNPSYLGTVSMTKIPSRSAIESEGRASRGQHGDEYQRRGGVSRSCAVLRPAGCSGAAGLVAQARWWALGSWSRIRRRHRQCLWASVRPAESNWWSDVPARAGGLLRADQAPSSAAPVATEGCAESLVLPAQPTPSLLPAAGWLVPGFGQVRSEGCVGEVESSFTSRRAGVGPILSSTKESVRTSEDHKHKRA